MIKSIYDNKLRGKRGNVVFDEAAFLSAELLKTYAAFAIVNKSFKTGKDRDGNMLDTVRLRAIPESLPNQKFYISSASSTDMEYYKIFRDFAKEQLVGNPDYFVAHVDCEVAFTPTLHGQVVAPLLSKSMVESEMRTNPEKARREYYCEFTTGQSANAIIKRGVIVRNSETRAPLLYNDTNKRKFIFAYDPARSYDNSVITIMELYEDDNKEYKGRIVNCVNLLDVSKKLKTPMRTPDQVKYLKQLILDYNGNAPDYENILGIYIDSGSGGGGVGIADLLVEDWADEKGNMHKGLIDREYDEDLTRRFPNAVNKLHLISPSKFKPILYESLIEMMNLDKISFTADYDNKGYITVFETDDKKYQAESKRITDKLKKEGYEGIEFDEKFKEEMYNSSYIKSNVIHLDPLQEIALANIDAMKEEMVHMTRKKRDSGRDSFELAPEVANRLHDDRSYTAALLAYALSEKRREHLIIRKRQDSSDILSQFKIRTPQRQSSIFN